MPSIHRWRTSILSLMPLWAGSNCVTAEAAITTSALYEAPILVIDPGMHAALIKSAATDIGARWAVTGSADKTIRIWSLADGAPLRTIRMPAGPGDIGKVYAVAMSPDGALIAAGGWTRWTETDPQEQVYLFDRQNGALVKRIGGLPSVVTHLAFSPDGQHLAATFARGGVRVYSRQWDEEFRDGDYDGDSYGVDFALDGQLATTAWDGKVRLYGRGPSGNLQLTVTIAAPSGRQPFGAAFSPDGTRLAVGYYDGAAVDLLDGHTLAALPPLDLSGIDNGDLSNVAWSRDGRSLFAAGSYGSTDSVTVLVWGFAKDDKRRTFQVHHGLVSSLVSLPEDDLLITSVDPWLARLKLDGNPRWERGRLRVDFRGPSSPINA